MTVLMSVPSPTVAFGDGAGQAMAEHVAEFAVVGPWSLETSRGSGRVSPERYGPGHTLTEISQAWRPYRTWAAVHLRALREQRTGEIAGR